MKLASCSCAGFFGNVYKGRLSGAHGEGSGEDMEVAVKTLRGE